MFFRNFRIVAFATTGVLSVIVPVCSRAVGSGAPASATPRGDAMAQHGASAPSGVSPSLQADPASVSFDAVPQGASASRIVQLFNTSPAPLIVHDVTALGRGIEVSVGALPIALDPGQALLVRVAFTPKSGSSEFGAILIADTSDASPILVEVHASSVESPAALTPDQTAIDFSKTIAGSSASRLLVLTNRGDRSVRLLRAAVDGTRFSVSGLAETQLTSGQSLELHVAFNPSEPGDRSGSLAVVTAGANTPLRIPLSGTGVAASDHSAIVRWNADSNSENGYFVYRGTDPGGPYEKVNAAPTAETEFADSGLGVGQTYYYVITSVDSSNDESPYSNEVIVTVP